MVNWGQTIEKKWFWERDIFLSKRVRKITQISWEFGRKLKAQSSLTFIRRQDAVQGMPPGPVVAVGGKKTS